MNDLGELLIAAIMLSILGYYKLPGLRQWARSWFVVTIPDHSVKTPNQTPTSEPPLPSLQQPLPNATTPIATPTTPDNAPLPVAGLVNDFSDLDNKIALALARLIIESERRPFASGKVPEARAIEVVWDCRRSSRDGSVYQEARQLLQQHLATLRGGPEFYDDMIKRVNEEIAHQDAKT